MEPKNPYRKWVARHSHDNYFDLYAVEPDGFEILMRTGMGKYEAEGVARTFTDVERRAQLARENPNPEER